MSSKREVRVKPSLPVFRHQWEIAVGNFSYFLSPVGKHGVPQIEIKDYKKQSVLSTEEDEDNDSDKSCCEMPDLNQPSPDPPDLDPSDLHLVELDGPNLDPCQPGPDTSDRHLVDLDGPNLDPCQPGPDPSDRHLVDPDQVDPNIHDRDQSQEKVEYYIRQRKLEVRGSRYLSKKAVKDEFKKRRSRMESGSIQSKSATEMDHYKEISKSLCQIAESLIQKEEFTFSVEVKDVAGFTTKTDDDINQVVNLLNDRPAPFTDEMDLDEWSHNRDSFAKRAEEFKVPFVSPDHSWADRVPISCDELSYQFTSWLIVEKDEGDERIVKLGRKPILLPIAHHWAIQVGDKWCEIIQKNWETRRNAVNICTGYAAISTAGKFGGELVGKSAKTDKMIITWLNM